jgi:hypothetical protein
MKSNISFLDGWGSVGGGVAYHNTTTHKYFVKKDEIGHEWRGRSSFGGH